MYRTSRFTLLISTLVLAFQAAVAAIPTNYYSKAIDKSDEDLMSALCNIIRNHKEVSYTSGLLSAFKSCDTDAQGYIIDIYSNCKYKPSDNGSSAKHIGEGYNREHSFPRSWFNGEVAPMNTDVFHVYPTDIAVNSQRGNEPYGVCANGVRLPSVKYVARGKLGMISYPGYYGTVFEPDDEYKGDLARTYFYMVTCYKNELPTWPGSPNLNYSLNKYKAFSTWTINMLMEWTRLDPVSEKEIKRNDAVYKIQNNRNPFIDCPELAEYIWGDKQGQQWKGPGSQIIPAITSPANGSSYDMGSTTIGKDLTYSIYLKGNNLSEGLSLTMSNNDYFYASRNDFSANEVNQGITFTVTFLAEEEGSYRNTITVNSKEASTTFTMTAKATQGDGPNPPDPPVVLGDSITEDWEGCPSGGYYTTMVQGHAWKWDFNDAGLWGDNLRHGEMVCRLGKSSGSGIAMAEDLTGTSAIGFWAGCFGNDGDAVLSVEYSTDNGTSWTVLGTVTVTKGSLQYILMDANVAKAVRYQIVKTSGARVNIDDITLYGRPQELTGDVNGDGEVNIADINALVDIILGENVTDENLKRRADVNNDSEITIADINALIDLIL